MEILCGHNISVSFKEKNIINNLDLSIDEGKIVTLIGPNGSGKTTLLRAFCRNLRPNEGTVYLNGNDIFKMKNKNVAKELAIMNQNYGSSGDTTVKDLVQYGRFAHKKLFSNKSDEDKEAVNWALKKTGMDKFSHRIVETLSGGERQRAWIAMALAQRPKVLVLDEPTTFLDICYQIEILELIYSLNREDNITVVMVLHDINQAAKYSDELVVIRNGQVYDKGSPLEIINEVTMKEVFNVKGSVTIDKDMNRPMFIVKGIWSE